VHKNLRFSDSEAAFLRELIREKVDFMIVGLAAAALQGAPVVTQDVDLWFKDLGHPGIRKALRKVGGAYVPPIGLNPPTFAGDAVNLIDIVVHMPGLDDFDRERERALRIPLGRFKVTVLALERIMASKRAVGREKDKLVLPALASALLAIRKRGPAPRKSRKSNA
jgi:hypothetical protein